MTFIDTNADAPTVRWFHLFELALPGAVTLHWTDDQLPIYTTAGNPLAGAQAWLPYVVTPDGISTEQGVTASAGMTIGNADNLFGTYLFGGADITGSIIKVWQAWLDATAPGQTPQEVRQVFLGRVGTASLQRSAAASDVHLALSPYADPSTKLVPPRAVADLLRH